LFHVFAVKEHDPQDHKHEILTLPSLQVNGKVTTLFTTERVHPTKVGEVTSLLTIEHVAQFTIVVAQQVHQSVSPQIFPLVTVPNIPSAVGSIILEHITPLFILTPLHIHVHPGLLHKLVELHIKEPKTLGQSEAYMYVLKQVAHTTNANKEIFTKFFIVYR